MTYASGGLIEAVDYNTLGWTNPSIGGQWGVGTERHGLGQNTSAITPVPVGTGSLDTVSVGDTVTAVQWTGLIAAINNCLNHEGQTPISPTYVQVGDTITWYNSIATGTALAYNNSGTTGLALSAASPNNTVYSSAWGTSGARSLVFTQSLTFASGNAARYFFNAGGQIRLSFSRTGGTASNRNMDWTSLCNACGTIVLGWNTTTQLGGSNSPAPTINSLGYWGLTGSPVMHFRGFDEGGGPGYGYANNFIKVEVYGSGATGTGGGYSTINLVTTWDNNDFSWPDSTDGTATTAAVVHSPATTYLTNTWGTPGFAGSVTPV